MPELKISEEQNPVITQILTDVDGDIQMASPEADMYQNRSQVLNEASDDTVNLDLINGLVHPPYNPDRLLWLREICPTHGSAIQQLTNDIVGNGWFWQQAKDLDEGVETDTSQPKAIEDFFNNVSESTFQEQLMNVTLDYKTFNYAGLEILRNENGVPEDFFYIPGHTFRIHKDNARIAQRQGKRVTWFKIWNPLNEEQYLASNGSRVGTRSVSGDKIANDVLLFRRGVGRSSFYGVPPYVSALGAISLYTASRDYNIRYFENNAIPAWAVTVEGGELSKQVEKTIKDFFRTTIRKNPHKTFVLSIPAASVRPGAPPIKVKFHKLADFHRDGSFIKLKVETDKEILVAHRVPPYRVGWALMGTLGGNPANEMDKNYRSGVIEPDQLIVESRLNAFFKHEFDLTTHVWKLKDADIEDSLRDLERQEREFKIGAATIDEIRSERGKRLLGPENGGNVVYVDNVPIGELFDKANGSTDDASPKVLSLRSRQRENGTASSENVS